MNLFSLELYLMKRFPIPSKQKIMSKTKKDERKQLLIRYTIDETELVHFVDPCCDEIPVYLFGKIMVAISNVEKEWNSEIEKTNNQNLKED